MPSTQPAREQDLHDAALALLQDPDSPFFTTDHFAGHPSVLVQVSRLPETTRAEITELVQAAWLSRASRTRAQAWLDCAPPLPQARRHG